MDKQEKFVWIDIYKEIAKKLVEFKDNQKELVDILRKMKTAGLKCMSINDKKGETYDTELNEIDPFTFFANFNRGITDENRTDLIEFLKDFWGLALPVPKGFPGIPVVNNQKAWFFAWQKDRGVDDIPTLWDLFREALAGEIKEATFNKALKVKNVRWNLTMGLYWINPEKYLNLDSVNRSFLEEKGIHILGTLDYNTYFANINQVKRTFKNQAFYEISYDAWIESKKGKEINYWIFQANPKIWRIIDALKNDAVHTWSVRAHKDNIKSNDKFILYVTGSDAGIYATGEVIGGVYVGRDNEEDLEYSIEPDPETATDRVQVKIKHQWLENPITKDEIQKNQKLHDLKVGSQGTNFTATKEEYQEILKLRGNKMKKSGIRYWLYTPGENAKKWDEFYSSGIMALGWPELGDLNKYQNKEEIAEKLRELEKTTSSKKNDALACFEFSKTLKNGDIVIAKKGQKEYIGWGVIESDYYYNESAMSFKHNRKVNWNKKGNWPEIAGPIVSKTLTDITRFPKYVEKICSLMGINRKEKGPEFLRFFEPIVEILKELDGAGKSAEVTDLVIDRLNIPREEVDVTLKSGISRVKNQVHWARMYLVNTRIIDSSQRGIWRLTDKGFKINLSSHESVYKLFKEVQDKYAEEPDDTETKYEIDEEVVTIDVIYSDLCQKIEFDTYLKYQPLSLSDPQRIKIHQIIEKCEATRWVIPHFQRYFDWNKTNIKEFLESIFYDYYVGSFLLWEVNRQPELGIQPIRGLRKKIDELNPSGIILDGQQRITALFYAIKSPDIDIKGSQNRLFFYINFQNFLLNEDKTDIVEIHTQEISQEATFRRILFPLNKLEKYLDWIFEFEDFLDKNNVHQGSVKNLRRVIEKKLSHFWSGFEIPYISLPERLKLTQVTDIFENINTKGKLLNVFDLLIARLYKYDIPLKQLWDGTLNDYNIIKRYYIEGKIEKLPIYILQTISLYYSKTSSCKRADILNIYSLVYEKNSDRNFFSDWDEMSFYMGLALEKLENMRDGFGVHSEKNLPFASMIPVLSALLKVIDNENNKLDCYKKINIWYWSAVFTTAYSSAADSQMTADFKEVKNWFTNDDEVPKVVEAFKQGLNNLNLFDIQSTSNAKYKGILSLLALEGARDFNTGEVLENSRENDKDHIFPKAMAKIPKKYINSILNITWMSDKTNRNIKKHKRPSIYINDFLTKIYNNNLPRLKKILRSHFIDETGYRHLLNDDFDSFINNRQDLLKSKLIEILGMKNVKVGIVRSQSHVKPQEEDNDSELLIKNGENEKVEFKSSLRWSFSENSVDKKLEQIIMKTIAAFNNCEGGTLFIGVNDKGQIIGLNHDYDQASLKNNDKFELHLTTIINNQFGETFAAINLKITFPKIGNKEICRVDISKGSKEVYLKIYDEKMNKKTEKFYIRIGNSSRELDKPSEIVKYIENRFSQ